MQRPMDVHNGVELNAAADALEQERRPRREVASEEPAGAVRQAGLADELRELVVARLSLRDLLPCRGTEVAVIDRRGRVVEVETEHRLAGALDVGAVDQQVEIGAGAYPRRPVEPLSINGALHEGMPHAGRGEC